MIFSRLNNVSHALFSDYKIKRERVRFPCTKSRNLITQISFRFQPSVIVLFVLADYDSLQALIERRPRRKRTLSFWPHCTTLWTSCIVMKRVTVTFEVSYIAIRAIRVLPHVWAAATGMVWAGGWQRTTTPAASAIVHRSTKHAWRW